MQLRERLSAFVQLGEIMLESVGTPGSRHGIGLMELIEKQHMLNSWFTPVNVRMAVEAIGKMLTLEYLGQWISPYSLPKINHNPLTVALVLAGNVPLVGFHDLMTVLLTGNRALVKTSSKDPELIRRLSEILIQINPSFNEMVSFTEGIHTDYDAVIATGSDNSSRYFEYQFGDKPHIFRKNRTSVSIIANDTTDDELIAHGSDLFSYFGMGCRNVSKIFVEKGFDLNRLLTLWSHWAQISDHTSYKNNYKHSRALLIVDQEKFIDGGFFLLKESKQTASPLSVIHYELFDHKEEVKASIRDTREKIQCIIAPGFTPYGKAQHPDLSDYADDIDTMKFLLSLK